MFQALYLSLAYNCEQSKRCLNIIRTWIDKQTSMIKQGKEGLFSQISLILERRCPGEMGKLT
jgi:hypothetical protein